MLEYTEFLVIRRKLYFTVLYYRFSSMSSSNSLLSSTTSRHDIGERRAAHTVWTSSVDKSDLSCTNTSLIRRHTDNNSSTTKSTTVSTTGETNRNRNHTSIHTGSHYIREGQYSSHYINLKVVLQCSMYRL